MSTFYKRMARYLEFDSTYRDRNCYPCPGDFTVEVSCTTDTGGLNAKDYAAELYPANSWFQVPYTGSDPNDLVSSSALINGSLAFGDLPPIPRLVNLTRFNSLWPVDWLNGAAPEYEESLSLIYGFSPTIPKTGTRGAGFSRDSNGAEMNDPLFWRDIAYRTLNIQKPGRFAGGTSGSPVIDPESASQVKSANYLKGATLIKFSENPLNDGGITSPEGGGGPIGSLGFAYYYRVFSIIPSTQPEPFSFLQIGSKVTDESGILLGYLAATPSTATIVIRVDHQLR